MSTLFQSYEEEYRDVVDAIRVGIDGLRATLNRDADGYVPPPATGAASRLQRGADLARLTAQVRELLSNMEYECNDVSPAQRQSLRDRLAECKRNARSLEVEVAKTRSECATADRLDLIGDSTKKGSASVGAGALGLDDETAKYRRQMMTNTERVKQASNTLTRAERLLTETEETGTTVMQNLRTQTETMHHISATTNSVNEEISESSKIMAQMHRTMIKHKIMLIGIILFLVFLICVAVYVSMSKNSRQRPVQPPQRPTEAPSLPTWGPQTGGGLPDE